MKKMTIQEAAKKLKISEDEVKRMCKSGSLEVVEVPGGVPEVSEQSVFEFLGEEYVEPETTHKRRGRQPKVITLQEAAELLNREIGGSVPADEDSVAQMAFDDVLEEWELPNSEEMGVTNRSVQSFLKEVAETVKKESVDDTDGTTNKESETEETPPPAMIDPEKDKEATKLSIEAGLIPEPLSTVEKTFAEKSPFDVLDEIEETLKDGLMAREEALKKLGEFPPGKVIPLEDEEKSDFKTYTSCDMQAAVKIARMEGELSAYRSMQSFERRA